MSVPFRGQFSGIWPALLTPLTAELDIDTARFAAHARRLLEAGCGGVTPFGTTGEGPSFSVAERMAGVDALVAAGVPAARILVSTSCAALPDVVALTRHALAIGAHGCLMLPPFFLKGVPEQGVIDAYAQVINRVADDQMNNGTAVSRDELAVGDLVFFGSGSYASHVGMYIGNGNFVHAANPSSGVRISSLNETYYNNRYIGARRIITG